MKKIICILLLCTSIILCISCCTSEKVENSYKNKIYPAKLTEEEEEILKLVGFQSDTDIYKYEIDDTYKSLSIWLEVYENGELKSKASRINAQLDLSEGKIAIVVDKGSNYRWRISRQDVNGSSSYSFNTNNDFETNNKFSVSSGALNEPAQIISDNEIVLDTFLFEDGDAVSVYDNQYYVENPEVLKEYDYAYLLKCQFSNKTTDEINNQQ